MVSLKCAIAWLKNLLRHCWHGRNRLRSPDLDDRAPSLGCTSVSLCVRSRARAICEGIESHQPEAFSQIPRSDARSRLKCKRQKRDIGAGNDRCATRRTPARHHSVIAHWCRKSARLKGILAHCLGLQARIKTPDASDLVRRAGGAGSRRNRSARWLRLEI